MRQLVRSSTLLILGALLVAAGGVCWISGIDLRLHSLLRLPGDLWPPRVIRLSALGGLIVMGPFGLLGVLILALRRRGGDALWLLITIVSGRLGTEGLKLLFVRPRPPLIDRLELVTSWSFPSSHSAGTMLTCVALAIVIGRAWALVGALVVAIIIGWTRLALGVHWVGDVLGGWGFALVWLGLAVRFRPGRAAQTRVGNLR